MAENKQNNVVVAIGSVMILGYFGYKFFGSDDNDTKGHYVAGTASAAPAAQPPKDKTEFDRDPKWPPDRTPGRSTPISATDLAAAYEANELKADAAFKGQVLHVSGRVGKVERFMGDIIVSIGDVKAYMVESEASAVAELKPGQKVTVEAWGAGAMAMGSPKLKSAVLIPMK